MNYEIVLSEILDFSGYMLSDIMPSTWNEHNRTMTSAVSNFPGKFNYDLTPYLKEIVNLLHPSSPAKRIAIKKGAQIGFSTGVIEAGIGWIISENPGNTLFLTGNSTLSEEAMSGKIDQMIDSCGLRPLIKPSVLRKRNQRTGDTNKSKEFPGGSLVAGSANNHSLLRQRSCKYGFIDDFEDARKSASDTGNTRILIEQRFASYSDSMKLFYISTPETKEGSNIEPVYLLGDQRKYFIPCPCCGEYIDLQWSVDTKVEKGSAGGIVWKLDEVGKVIEGSVGYRCQLCGGFFDDRNKSELLRLGEWRATATASTVGYFSYHLSALYAPPGMFDWAHYVNQYLEADPPGGTRKEDLYQSFVNVVLGECYEPIGEAPKANMLQKNIRNYEIGIVPERVSMKDGNGKILLLTCACDLNGTEDDARLDYEVVAWSESGASYSVMMGSIGTFIPLEGSKKYKVDREHWTYRHNGSKSVWPVFNEVLETLWKTDTDRTMKIYMSGVDSGHYTEHAYEFVDKKNIITTVALKGDKENKYRKFWQNNATFKTGKERGNLYLVDVNMIKDQLAQIMKLRWDEGNDDSQPALFMNYPTPSGGKYLFENYFSHFESEMRKESRSKSGEIEGWMWQKVQGNSQNHFWDVRVYNMVLRDILVMLVCKEAKVKNYSWVDYVEIMNKAIGE